MNMYCSTDLSRCRCKEDMRWNKEELECQVGIIVNGSLGLTSVKSVDILVNFFDIHLVLKILSGIHGR